MGTGLSAGLDMMCLSMEAEATAPEPETRDEWLPNTDSEGHRGQGVSDKVRYDIEYRFPVFRACQTTETSRPGRLPLTEVPKPLIDNTLHRIYRLDYISFSDC